MENGEPQPKQQFIDYVPVFNRLARGEAGHTVVFDVCTNVINGLEKVRQGCLTVRDSSVTNAIATKTYAAGVNLCTATQNLYNWAYAERSKGKEQPTFHQALTTFNTNMPSIFDQSRQEESRHNILESLTIIREDMSLITLFINQAKDKNNTNSSGIRTTVIDHVSERVQSQSNPITERESQDCINVINAIAQSSKNKDGEKDFTESTVFEPIIEDGKELLSQLEEEVNSILNGDVLSNFRTKYMSQNTKLNKIIQDKTKQNTATVLVSQQIQEIKIKEQKLIEQQIEAEKLATERLAKVEAEKAETQRLERLEAEKLEALELKVQQKLEEEFAKLEAEKLEVERLAKLEAKKLATQQALDTQLKLGVQKLEQEKQAQNSKYRFYAAAAATFGIFTLFYAYTYNKLPETLTNFINNMFSTIVSNRYYSFAR